MPQITDLDGRPLDTHTQRRIIDAIVFARRQRDAGRGTVAGTLNAVLGERLAGIALANLMWADPGFAPPIGRR